MAPSWFQLLIVILLIVLLFGRGKISEVMGDFAKGIKSFKKGLNDDKDEPQQADSPKTIESHVASSPDMTATRENVRAG